MMKNIILNYIKKVFDRNSTSQAVLGACHSAMLRTKDSHVSLDPISFDETFTGNVCSLKEVTVLPGGMIVGNITSSRCIIAGKVRGDVKSSEDIRIKSTAIITGNISSPYIHIEPGAIINGSVRVGCAKDEYDLIKDSANKLVAELIQEQLMAPYAARTAESIVAEIEVKGRQEQQMPPQITQNRASKTLISVGDDNSRWY